MSAAPKADPAFKIGDAQRAAAPLLEVLEIEKTFPGVSALSGVSLAPTPPGSFR